MLKHVAPILTPSLFKAIMEMGHGETLLICDANYPGVTDGGNWIYITNCTISELLGYILYYFPLDKSADFAATVMESSRAEGRYETYKALVESQGSKLQDVNRFEFYRYAEKAVTKVVTTDIVKGGNILLQKGSIVKEDIDVKPITAQ